MQRPDHCLGKLETSCSIDKSFFCDEVKIVLKSIRNIKDILSIYKSTRNI